MTALPGDNAGGTLPFEGSAEIAGIVASLIEKWKVTTFVETGTQRGATALWATGHGIRVITIESDVEQHREACANLEMSGAEALCGDSATLLYDISFKRKESVLFYLDAHSIKGTPILSEIAAIGKLIKKFKIFPVICIHDFEVPGHPELGFDRYEDGTSLNFALINNAMSAIGMAGQDLHYNSIPDGASRGFAYVPGL